MGSDSEENSCSTWLFSTYYLKISFQHNQQNVLSGHNQQSSLASQSQNTVSAPLYNTMVISQPTAGNVVQVPSSLPQNNNQNAAAVTTFTQDRQIR